MKILTLVFLFLTVIRFHYRKQNDPNHVFADDLYPCDNVYRDHDVHHVSGNVNDAYGHAIYYEAFFLSCSKNTINVWIGYSGNCMNKSHSSIV